jgi:hypothetical protein
VVGREAGRAVDEPALIGLVVAAVGRVIPGRVIPVEYPDSIVREFTRDCALGAKRRAIDADPATFERPIVGALVAASFAFFLASRAAKMGSSKSA